LFDLIVAELASSLPALTVAKVDLVLGIAEFEFFELALLYENLLIHFFQRFVLSE